MTLHMFPSDDRIVHDVSKDCACGPRAEIATRADGHDGQIIIVHNTVCDGLELSE